MSRCSSYAVEESIWHLRVVISTNSTFRTLIDPSWPLEGSQMVDFGVDYGWLILDATLIKIRLSGCFGRPLGSRIEIKPTRKTSRKTFWINFMGVPSQLKGVGFRNSRSCSVHQKTWLSA